MSTEQDRRMAVRHLVSTDDDVLAVRIRPGRSALMLDVSPAGALLETQHRLLPGSTLELQMVYRGQLANVAGRIVRCEVTRLLPNSLWYRCAIRFDCLVPWLVNDGKFGYLVPVAEKGSCETERGKVTPHGR